MFKVLDTGRPLRGWAYLRGNRNSGGLLADPDPRLMEGKKDLRKPKVMPPWKQQFEVFRREANTAYTKEVGCWQKPQRMDLQLASKC